MIARNRIPLLLALALVTPLAVAAQSAAPTDEPARMEAAQLDRLDEVTRTAIRTLPVEWQVMAAAVVPADQAERIAGRLGVSFEALANARLTVCGKPIGVNTFTTASMEEARAVHQVLLPLKGGNRNACRVVGTSVVEFVCDSDDLIRGANWDLGLQPRPTAYRYEISFTASPVAECTDYMQWNALFNAIRAAGLDTASDQDRDRVTRLAAVFRGGDRLRLRTVAGAAAPVLSPSPLDEHRTGSGDVTAYRFGDLPQRRGFPAVEVRTTVVVEPGPRAGPPPAPALTRATAFWPSKDADVAALAEHITAGAETATEQVDALLQWLTPNRNIRYRGGVTGSRYGVRTVLEQQFGHCWDFSDCFVTLCRARGIPARQVLGWLYGAEGHVWAEVFIEGEGWRQVDPTGGGRLACRPYHVGWITSEDGHVSMLYLTWPEIELRTD